MTALLDTQLGSENEATDGRFFVTPEQKPTGPCEREFWLFSSGFFANNSDLLIESGASIVLQVGVENGSDLVETGKGSENLTVVFDASMRSSHGQYNWGLTFANQESGMTTVSLYGTSAIEREYDTQGVMRFEEEKDPADVRSLIVELMTSDSFKSLAEAKRAIRESSERQLAQFSVEAIGKYSEIKYQNLIDKKSKSIERHGFTTARTIRI